MDKTTSTRTARSAALLDVNDRSASGSGTVDSQAAGGGADTSRDSTSSPCRFHCWTWAQPTGSEPGTRNVCSTPDESVAPVDPVDPVEPDGSTREPGRATTAASEKTLGR